MRVVITSNMKTIIKFIPFTLAKNFFGSHKLIIVYYHLVSDRPSPHIKHLYHHKTVKDFIQDLEFLLKRYSPVGLQDVIAWVRGKTNLPENCFLLTFDDGFREIYDVVAPILVAKGIPAAFFITSTFLDNQNLFYRNKASLLVEEMQNGISSINEKKIGKIIAQHGHSFRDISDGILAMGYREREVLDRIADVIQFDFGNYLRERQPYLTSDQVQKLLVQGFEIGAHSIDHPYYSSLSLEEQVRQTLESVKIIRDKFRLHYGAFAFPHNDRGVSNEFFEIVNKSGIVDISFGTGGLVQGELQTHRQRVSLENPLRPAKEIIAWQYARELRNQYRQRMCKRLSRIKSIKSYFTG